jgi:hypothetical protein
MHEGASRTGAGGSPVARCNRAALRASSLLGSCSRGNGRSSPTDRRGMRLCESPVGRRERAERVGPPHRMLRRFLEAVNDDRDLERCLCGKCLYSDVRLVE